MNNILLYYKQCYIIILALESSSLLPLLAILVHYSHWDQITPIAYSYIILVCVWYWLETGRRQQELFHFNFHICPEALEA